MDSVYLVGYLGDGRGARVIAKALRRENVMDRASPLSATSAQSFHQDTQIIVYMLFIFPDSQNVMFLLSEESHCEHFFYQDSHISGFF